MAEPKKEGGIERLITRAEARKKAPAPPQSYWARNVAIIRRRIITGILFLIPIATTLWLLNFILSTIYAEFGPLLSPILQHWGMKPDSAAYKAAGVVLALIIVIAMLYLFGLVTSRTAVKRLIRLAESLVARIPLVKFIYKTSKQIADTLALPSSGSLKKVVVVDFPNPGIKALAFATGETPVEGEPEPWVNVFVAKTPNPTTGFLVFLPRQKVWETDLTLEEGVRFIISGGILHPDNIVMRPYQPAGSAPMEDEESGEPPEGSPV